MDIPEETADGRFFFKGHFHDVAHRWSRSFRRHPSPAPRCAIVSLASLVLIVYGFIYARENGGEMLYFPPTFMAHIALTLMMIASVCLVAGFLPAGHIRTKLKFPLLVAIKIWALAHLLANGESYSVLLFATILAWAVILRITLKKRIASGETKLPVFVSAKYDIISVVAGLALYAVIVFKLHEWLIGVAPLP